jgi:riboflavin synthase
MFTGIVQDLCEVVGVEAGDGIRRLTVNLGPLAEGLELGASVANNGVCLTASKIDGPLVRFDVIGETLDVTNLSSVEVGDRVDIERSLKFGDELGGHILSGHISGQVTVHEIVTEGDNRTMWFDVPPELMRLLLWKGFVALDGASITISRVDRDANRIAVSLIPETLERTTLGRVAPGDGVNLEIDSQTQAIMHAVREIFSDEELRSQILESS